MCNLRLISLRLNNYKSIGDSKNYLLVEHGVTALIGKNESGKSNILESIGKLSFLSPLNAAYLNNKNRELSGEISIIANLEFLPEELDRFELVQSVTTVSFLDTLTIKFEGGLSELIKNHTLLIKTIEDIREIGSNNKIWGADASRLKTIRDYVSELEDVSTNIFTNYNPKLNNLKSWIKHDYGDKEKLTSKLQLIEDYLNEIYSLFPKIYLRKEDHQLEASYKYDDIVNILKDRTHIFNKFLQAAKISREEILLAFDERVDGTRKTIRNKIATKIDLNIGRKFNEFYKQEEIRFQIEIENRLFKIYILTDDKAMNLSERSNGLRWYVSLFVDILSYDYINTPIIFLLDEPGVFLHVNAQQKLLELFQDLSQRGNQVIYTTHSPYMIDSSNILNVRAIEKDCIGITRIHKNAYNQELSKDSKMETLSPLLKAIGTDLKFNIGPTSKDNVITEGISDYMYLKAMLNYIEVDNPPHIIPSTGVSNINKLVSILIGWGCDFKVVLDYDTAGYREYRNIINNLDETLQNKLVFVNCKLEIDVIDIKSNCLTIEDLITKSDFGKLNTPYNGTSSTKVLAAKEFYDKVTNREIQLDELTISRFSELFNHLGIKCTKNKFYFD